MTKINSTFSVSRSIVDEHTSGQRIDNFLCKHFKGVPKTRIYKALRKGEVRVNGGRISAEYKLQLDDEIRLPPLRVALEDKPALSPKLQQVQALNACILYENDDFLVVNKPANMAVHGGSGLEFGLIEALRALRPTAKHLELAHRLDKETSGCLLVAKKGSALRILHALLRDKKITKTYIALVKGKWPKRLQHVKAPLQRYELQSGERRVHVSKEGKPSETRVQVMEYWADATLIKAQPLTGRTHQIRVHALHAGHPLLGDEKYGDKEFNHCLRPHGLNRLFLHAARLQFNWPDSEQFFDFEAPLAADLQQVLESDYFKVSIS